MIKIAEIINQNPWWTQGIDFCRHDLHLKRAQPIFFKRKPLNLAKGNIYVLRGCRQVGKSTYLKSTAKELIEGRVSLNHILYLSLDFFTSRRELQNAINYFLDLTRDVDKVYLLFDEITSLENWNLELKYLADQGITQRSVIIATGSSAVRLKEKGELLPGRGLEGNEHYFKPLSFREFVLQTVEFISNHVSAEELQNSLGKPRSTLHDCSIDLWSNFEGLKDEKIQGNTVEGIVASHLLGHKEIPYLRNGKTFIWIYYNKQGKEIDAVIRQIGERSLIVPVDVFLSLLPMSDRNL